MTQEDTFLEDEFMSLVKVGHPIPDFSFEAFQNNDTKKLKLSQYRGKWLILFFYPADFTFVCPTELEELADNYAEFQKIGAEIVSFSCDTKWTHKAWHDESSAVKKITFPMGADPTGNIARAFGTYIEDEGVALRGTFVISPEGVLMSVEINHNDIGRNARELLRKLQAAKFVLEHGGQVCPASWEPGEKTLKPGLDLVGKI